MDVSYSYDSLGRMLTRVSGGVTTKYTWDGWNCVKEDDGTNVFRWYCPEDELHSFERNSAFYQVHSDALGSVRAITDSNGDVVGSYTYGAWGEILSASEPSGITMPYKWVGAYGIRHDPTTGLCYMRNRWYDGAGLQRFLSKDPLSKSVASTDDLRSGWNSLAYAENSPLEIIDPTGLSGAAAGAAAGWTIAWGIALGEPTPCGEIIVGAAAILAGASVA